jgi:hypothetical protein
MQKIPCLCLLPETLTHHYVLGVVCSGIASYILMSSNSILRLEEKLSMFSVTRERFR